MLSTVDVELEALGLVVMQRNPIRTRTGPDLQRTLTVNGGCERVTRSLERYEDGIAFGAEFHALMRGERGARLTAMLGEYVGVAGAELAK